MKIVHTLSSVLVTAAAALTLLPASGTRPVLRSHDVIVKSGEMFEGHRYPPGTRVRICDASGKVGHVILSDDFFMNNHLILRGTRLYVPNGKLTSYFSVDGQKINGIRLGKDFQVAFTKEGMLWMIHLKEPTVIGARLYPKDNWVEFNLKGEVVPTGSAVADSYSQ